MFFSRELTAFPNFKSAAIFMFSYTVKSSWSRSSCVMYEVDFLNSSVTMKFYDINRLVFRQIDFDRILSIDRKLRCLLTQISDSSVHVHSATDAFLHEPRESIEQCRLSCKIIQVKTCHNNSCWILNTCLHPTDPWSRSNYHSEKFHWPCEEFLSTLGKDNICSISFIYHDLFAICCFLKGKIFFAD